MRTDLWSHWKRKINYMLINFTFQYIDDLISLNSNFGKLLHEIYLQELSITWETHFDKEASYLDLFFTIGDNKFHTKLYEKRDYFGFSIINYPHPTTSNVSEKPAYDVKLWQ